MKVSELPYRRVTIEEVAGVMEDESRAILQDFFRRRRNSN